MAVLSGYCDCACPECFEIAFYDDDGGVPGLCWACEEAGCDGESSCEVVPEYESEEVGA